MCAGIHVSAYVYIVPNKYAMSVISEHESVNMIVDIYYNMCLIRLLIECK